ncbi:MAG: phage tail protein [Candidatus Pristimantibacillus sp.]
MGESFLGEIRLFSCSFPPKGWAECNGNLLPVNQNQPLFSILGTTYGGDGVTTLALPDLRGRVPIHFGAGIAQGQAGGKESHNLTGGELPIHNHLLQAVTTAATTSSPQNAVWAAPAISAYHSGGTGINTSLSTAATDNSGGNQPHSNMQPYLTLNFCICIAGIFPSRNQN